MDVNDFAADADLFKKKLGVRGFDVRGASKRLLGLADSWASVGQAHLGGLIKITAIPEESRIDGDILGKKFSIQYAPLGLEGDGALEAAISIQDLITGKPIELGRFLVSAGGAILSVNGEELINSEQHEYDYKLLVAVASRVINAPSKA